MAIIDSNGATDIVRARVFNRRATEFDWSAANPLLGVGEIAISAIGPRTIKFKVGDGALRYNSLPFAGTIDSELEVHAAVPSTNPGAPVGNRIYETATAGSYTYFLDINGNPIVVAAGQYVRLIDEGTYWSKVVVPGSVAGLATDADVRNWINSLYSLDYIQQPNRLPVASMFDVNTGNYTNPTPQKGHWYVDVRQSFDISRLSGVTISGFAPGLNPGEDAQITARIVYLSPTGVLTFASPARTINVTAFFNNAIDLSADAQTLAGAGTRAAYGLRAYVAIQADPGGTFDVVGLDPAYPGSQVWQYTNAGGNALILKLQDTAISYTVRLFGEPTIQTELNLSRLQTRVTSRNAGNQPGSTAYYATYGDSSILFDTTGWGAPAEVFLPRFNIPVGKVFFVTKIGGAQNLLVKTVDGAQIHGAVSLSLAGSNAHAWLQFDGSTYWQIG